MPSLKLSFYATVAILSLFPPNFKVFLRKSWFLIFPNKNAHIFVHLLLSYENPKNFLYNKKLLSNDKSFSSPYGNRTRVSAVRGRRLNRLTNEPFIILS